MQKLFRLFAELLIHSILILFFCRVEHSQYSLLRWWSRRGHDPLREHCALPGTIICVNWVLLWADSAAGLGPARIKVNVNAASLQSI